jgi:hypothetical protein
LAFSPGSLPPPDPHRSRLRRRAAGLSLLLHLLFLALLLWLPPPSFPGEYAITVRLALVEPSPPEEPLPPPTPKPQVKPTPTPSPSARSVQDSPRPPVGEARAKEGGKAQREGPRLGKSAEDMGVPGERARGVQPSGTERKGEVPGVPKPEAEGTAPAPGVSSAGDEELAPLAHAAFLGERGKEEKLGPFGDHAFPPQSPSAPREGLAPRSLGEAGVGADPLGPSGRGPVVPGPGREERLGPLGSDAPLSRNPSASGEELAPRSSGKAGVDADPLDAPVMAPVRPDPLGKGQGKAGVGADPLEASSSSGRGPVGPDPLGKGQGRDSGEEAGACALVVDVSGFPFTPNPSPALLDPEGNVVWPAKDRLQGIPERVVQESGIALFLRKGEFSEKGYARVLRVRAVGTRPRAPGSRFHDFALLDGEGAKRVKEVPPLCQVIFLY